MTNKTTAECSLSNEELIEKLQSWSDMLAGSGGDDWTLSIPVNPNKDPDCLIHEACDRLKQFESRLNAITKEVKGLRIHTTSESLGMDEFLDREEVLKIITKHTE